jgi:hypothetical protein
LATRVGNRAGPATTSDGHRYQQVTAGCILRGFAPLSRIRVTDLHLTDSFSNPINIQADADVTLERIVSASTGEGPQVLDATGVKIMDLDHDDLADVSRGDGIEISAVRDFVIERCRVRASAGGAGSAVDVFGSSDGEVNDFTSIGWAVGVDVHDVFSGTPISNNVTLQRLYIAGSQTGVLAGSGAAGRVRYTDVTIEGADIGVQAVGKEPLLLELKDVSITTDARPGTYGALVKHGRNVRLECAFLDGGGSGAMVEASVGQGPPSLTLSHVHAQNDYYGVTVSVADGASEPSITIEGGDYSQSGMGAYQGLPSGSRVEGAIPPWP